jgi:hypothetical protein
MGLYACVVLLLALHSIPVVEEDSLVVVDIPVAEEGNLEGWDNLAVEYILVADGNLVVAHTPGVDILEVAYAAQPCRIVVAHVDQDSTHALLAIVVQVVVVLLVVQMADPGCSYKSPFKIPDY